jgi:hypothetical protein
MEVSRLVDYGGCIILHWKCLPDFANSLGQFQNFSFLVSNSNIIPCKKVAKTTMLFPQIQQSQHYSPFAWAFVLFSFYAQIH